MRRLPAFDALVAMRRVSPLGRSVASVVLGGLPLLIAAAMRPRDLTVPRMLAAIVGGAAAAWLVDDTPGEVLVPVPFGETARRLIRAAYVVVVVLATMWLVVMLAASMTRVDTAIRPLAPLAAASASLAVALALVARRRGETAPCAWALTGAVVIVAVVGGLEARLGRWLPPLRPGPQLDRWWYVAAAAMVVSLIVGGDPGAARPWRPMRRAASRGEGHCTADPVGANRS